MIWSDITDYDVKSPTAVDYSDITETADEGEINTDDNEAGDKKGKSF